MRKYIVNILFLKGTRMKKQQFDELKKLPFEKALEALEGTVRDMEQGDMPLKDMMDSYEKGMVLSKICSEKLKSIEKKVEILKENATDGRLWEEFDSEETQTREAASAPVSEEKKNITTPEPQYNDTLFEL
jgi:exodeoxyribonuclease VII small subunit